MYGVQEGGTPAEARQFRAGEGEEASTHTVQGAGTARVQGQGRRERPACKVGGTPAVARERPAGE